MVYEHPLAYLLGVEGIALQRATTGHGRSGREFVERRIEEVRRLLDDPRLAQGVDVERVDTGEGYREWSQRYDTPNTAFFDLDVAEPLLDAVPVGIAVDAACGTGRWTAELVRRGHVVTGVDSSPEMLEIAREDVTAPFVEASVEDLPFPDQTVDLVVFALALSHVRHLLPVFAEFARVLRPGGTLIVSDVHPDQIRRGSIPSTPGPDGEPRRIQGYVHPVGAQFRAARDAGFEVLDCLEPVGHGTTPHEDEPGPWWSWPWTLEALVPEATDAAYEGLPGLLVWRFQR